MSTQAAQRLRCKGDNMDIFGLAALGKLTKALRLTGINGTATAGTTTSLTDSTQSMEVDSVKGKIIRVFRGATKYTRLITGNTATVMSFVDLAPVVNATATLGSGEGAEGQIVLTCIGTLVGAAGNAVTVECVSAAADTGDITASLAGDVLTFTVDTNAIGEPQALAAGSVETYLTTAELNTKFSVSGLVAGNLPLDGEAVAFEGGDDGISPVAGDEYAVF